MVSWVQRLRETPTYNRLSKEKKMVGKSGIHGINVPVKGDTPESSLSGDLRLIQANVRYVTNVLAEVLYHASAETLFTDNPVEEESRCLLDYVSSIRESVGNLVGVVDKIQRTLD